MSCPPGLSARLNLLTLRPILTNGQKTGNRQSPLKRLGSTEFWAKCYISEASELVGNASVERTPMAQMLGDVSIVKA